MGAIILVGGVTVGGEVLDTLYRLRHFNADWDWTLMPQRLQKARKFHAALVVDDEYTKCTDEGERLLSRA